MNDAASERDVVVCAAGSLPGDLHKLWRCRRAEDFHVEYGYSCMGYEVAGGLGVKMAAPDREVYVMVGDGSWLMMSLELVTSLQQGVKLTIVLIDNHGFASHWCPDPSRSARPVSERSIDIATPVKGSKAARCQWTLQPTRSRSAPACFVREPSRS